MYMYVSVYVYVYVYVYVLVYSCMYVPTRIFGSASIIEMDQLSLIRGLILVWMFNQRIAPCDACIQGRGL